MRTQKKLCNRSKLDAFSSWKPLAWHKHHGAVASPSMKLLVAQSAIFKCLWYAQRPLAQCLRMLARRYFIASKHAHACVARMLRLPCSAVVMSVSAWPFQRGASHRCAGFHILQNIKIELVEALSRDCFPTPFCRVFCFMLWNGRRPVTGFLVGSESWDCAGLVSSTRSQRHHSLARPVRSTSASVALLDQRHTQVVRLFFCSPSCLRTGTLLERSRSASHRRVKQSLRMPISRSVCRACEIVQR